MSRKEQPGRTGPKSCSTNPTSGRQIIAMKGPPYDTVDSDFNILEHLHNVPDGLLHRYRREYTEEVAHMTERVEKMVLNCKGIVSKSDYLKTLKELYEETGEVPSSFFLYYLGQMYRPKHVSRTQISQFAKGRSKDVSQLPASHMERMDDEIMRLQRIVFDHVSKEIEEYSEKCKLRLEMLTYVSNWLSGQQFILGDHLDHFSEAWGFFDEIDDISLYKQLQNFMEYLEKAVNQTRNLSYHLFGLALNPHDNDHQKKDRQTTKVGMTKLTASQVPSVGVMLKSKDRFAWGVRKVSDILKFCNQMTKNIQTQHTLECGLELFNNMMEVIEQNFVKMERADENMAFLHKKLAETCKTLEEGTDKLNQIKSQHQTLKGKHQELTQKLSKVLVDNEVLQRKLDHLGTMLTGLSEETPSTSSQQTPDDQVKVDEKMKQFSKEDEVRANIHPEIEFYKDATCHLKCKIDNLKAYAAKLEAQIGHVPDHLRHMEDIERDEATDQALQKAEQMVKNRRKSEIENLVSPSGTERFKHLYQQTSPPHPEQRLVEEAQSKEPKTGRSSKKPQEAVPEQPELRSPREPAPHTSPVSTVPTPQPQKLPSILPSKSTDPSTCKSPVTVTPAASTEVQSIPAEELSEHETSFEAHGAEALTTTVETIRKIKSPLKASKQPEPTTKEHEVTSKPTVQSKAKMQQKPASQSDKIPKMARIQKKSAVREKSTEGLSPSPGGPVTEGGGETLTAKMQQKPASKSDQIPKTSQMQKKPAVREKSAEGLSSSDDGETYAVSKTEGFNTSTKTDTDDVSKTTEESKKPKKGDIADISNTTEDSKKPKKDMDMLKTTEKSKKPKRKDIDEMSMATDESKKSKKSEILETTEFDEAKDTLETSEPSIEQNEKTAEKSKTKKKSTSKRGLSKEDKGKDKAEISQKAKHTERVEKGVSPPTKQKKRKDTLTRPHDRKSISYTCTKDHEYEKPCSCPMCKDTQEEPNRGIRAQPRLEDVISSSDSEGDLDIHDIRAVCVNIMQQFLSLGLNLSLIFDNHGFKDLATSVRLVHDTLSKFIKDKQYDVLKGLAQAVETYFKQLQILVQKALSGIDTRKAEERIKQMRQEKINDLHQKTAILQSKQSSLEEQYRSLWFMHLTLCEAVLNKRQNRPYTYMHENAVFNETPVTPAEDNLRLPKGIIEANWTVLIEAYQNNTISEKCLKKGQDCLEALDCVYNCHLPFLVRLFVIDQRIAEAEQLTNDQCQLNAGDSVQCQKWKRWCDSLASRLRSQFQNILVELSEWKTEKPKIIFRAWFLFNQILLETGVKLTCPQPHMACVDDLNGTQFSKLAKDLSKKRRVPVITADNYQELVSAGKLPAAYSKRTPLTCGSDDTLQLHTRTSVNDAVASHGFRAKQLSNDSSQRKRMEVGAINKNQCPQRLIFKRSSSIEESLLEEPEEA